ncbi:TPA: TonB family protein [Klebsiella aerogenes]|nr:TonB family protein [Klebsiella aerogenes]HCT8623084.1 TonB family protein [Klebsiella aerogenes]HCT8632715.1 TonB family protein [Klebsiella aerogenes]HCT8713747.1 TonB family protein [Klebsiella aerogenes]
MRCCPLNKKSSDNPRLCWWRLRGTMKKIMLVVALALAGCSQPGVFESNAHFKAREAAAAATPVGEEVDDLLGDLSSNKVTAAPVAVSRAAPFYPAQAQALKIEGRVRVKYDVMADGRVDNVEILSAQPANIFEREVKNAMKNWRFVPNKPVNGAISTITFRLNGGATLDK